MSENSMGATGEVKSTPQPEVLETFNGSREMDSVKGNQIETFDDLSTIKVPKEKTEKKIDMDKKYPDADKKSQVELLDNKDPNKTKKEEKDEGTVEKDDGKGDSKEGKGKEVEEGKSTLTKEPEQKVSGKIIKAKSGDQELELSPETEFRQKVDGKYETIKLRDLLNQGAGKISIDRRITELSKEKKQFVQEKTQYSTEKEQVIKHLSTISNLLDDKEATPFDVLQYLVDISGRDHVSYQKKVMEYLNKELITLGNMTESEQQLYWKDKEIQSLRKSHEASSIKQKQQQVHSERATSIDKMRESQGVTKEQFSDAYDTLVEKAGEGKFTAEQVIEEAKMAPHNSRAKELTAPFEEDVSSDDFGKLVKEVAKISKEFPHFNDEEVVVNAAKKIGLEVSVIDEDEEALKAKLDKTANAPRGSTNGKVYRGKVFKVDENEIEMFSDD